MSPACRTVRVLMATDANKDLLAEMGIQGPDVLAATANDLVVAILADDASLVERLLGEMDARLTSTYRAPAGHSLPDDRGGIAAHPQSTWR